MATYNANAGAGSGYLRYDSLPMTKATTAMARVGDRGEGSWITVDGITTEARAGETVNNAGGGNGYCGGGQQGNAGGTDGGNGVGGTSEGQGTGEDVQSFKMDNFVLSPGAGGLPYRTSYGGGGGGVRVNGIGPGRNSETQGDGYGGVKGTTTNTSLKVTCE